MIIKIYKIIFQTIGGSQSEMDKKLTKCRVLTSCDHLQKVTKEIVDIVLMIKSFAMEEKMDQLLMFVLKKHGLIIELNVRTK